MIPSWYPLDSNDVNGIFFEDYAKMLVNSGCKVGIISPQLISVRDTYRLMRFYRYIKVTITRENGATVIKFSSPNIPKWLKPAYYIRMTNFLYNKYIKENGIPDIIVAQSSIWAGVAARSLSKRTLIPYIVIEHNSKFLGNGKLTELEINEARKAFLCADSVVAVSEKLAESIKKLLSIDLNITSIGNPVTVESSLQSDYKNFQRTGIISVAMMNKNKQIDKIIRSYGMSRARKTHILTLIGDGPQRTALEELVVELDLTRVVNFRGKLNRSEIFEVMQQNSIFISSSKAETFGISIVEALMNGLPVVATRSGGPESIINSSNGVLSNSDSLEDLCKSLDEIDSRITSFDRSTISKNASFEYSPEEIAKLYLTLFGKVISKAAQR